MCSFWTEENILYESNVHMFRVRRTLQFRYLTDGGTPGRSSPGDHSSVSTTVTSSTSTTSSLPSLLSSRKASMKGVNSVGFRCISPQPKPSPSALTNQATPVGVKLVAPFPVKMVSSPSSSALNLYPEHQLNDSSAIQSDKERDTQILITKSCQDDEQCTTVINIRSGISAIPQLYNLDKAASSVATSPENGYESSEQLNDRGSLCKKLKSKENKVDRPRGLGLGELVTTNWSAATEVNRSNKVNNYPETGMCVSNTASPTDGFSDSVVLKACFAGVEGWQNRDGLTCGRQISSNDMKSDANSDHLTQECVHPEHTSITVPESGRCFTRSHDWTASLLSINDHMPPDSSTSSFTSLGTKPNLLSNSRADHTSAISTSGDCVVSQAFTTPRSPCLTASFQSSTKAAESKPKLSHPVTCTATSTLSNTQALTASVVLTAGTDNGYTNMSANRKLTDTQTYTPVIEEVLDFACHYTAGVLQGLPPLFLAAAERNITAVRLLLKYGANPNYQDSEGCTPLHLSASVEFQSWECAVGLIEHGAKVYIPNRYGTTPAELSPDLTKEHIRILTDTLINTILSTRLLSTDIQQQAKRRSHKDHSGCHKSISGSDGWSILSAKLRKRRSYHYINSEALVRKASARKERSREGSVGRSDLLSTGSERERTSSFSSTRSRFSFNFANKHSTSPPPSNIEDSEMDSKSTDPERVSQLLILSLIFVLLPNCNVGFYRKTVGNTKFRDWRTIGLIKLIKQTENIIEMKHFFSKY